MATDLVLSGAPPYPARLVDRARAIVAQRLPVANLTAADLAAFLARQGAALRLRAQAVLDQASTMRFTRAVVHSDDAGFSQNILFQRADGRWIFIGRTDVRLRLAHADGEELTEEDAAAAHTADYVTAHKLVQRSWAPHAGRLALDAAKRLDLPVTITAREAATLNRISCEHLTLLTWQMPPAPSPAAPDAEPDHA